MTQMCGLLILSWFLPSPGFSPACWRTFSGWWRKLDCFFSAVWVLGPSHPLRTIYFCSSAHRLKAYTNYMILGCNTRRWSCYFIFTERKHLTFLSCALVTLQKVHKSPSGGRTNVYFSVSYQDMPLLAMRRFCLQYISLPPASSQSLPWRG